MTPRAYATALVATVATAVLGVGGFNWLIDPFALYGNHGLEGVNTGKPLIERHLRLHKPHAVRRAQPSVVILGSSRAFNGIDPQDPALAAIGRGYNLAVPDANAYELRRLGEHALAATPVELLVVVCDFFAWMTPQEGKANLDPGRLAVSLAGARQRLAAWHDTGPTLLSRGGTWWSWQTYHRQGRESTDHLARFLADGFGRGLEPYVAEHGQRAAFVRKEVGYMLTRLPKFPPAKRSAPRRQEASAHLAALLAAAADVDCAVWLATAPIHARLNEVLRWCGYDAALADWRRELAAVASAARAAHPDWDLRALDFAGFNPVTTEPVPPFGSQERMVGYWEDSHFTPATGSRMLARLAGGDDPDFGVDLEPAAIEAALAAEEASRAAWAAAQPEQAQEALELVEFLHDHSGESERIRILLDTGNLAAVRHP